MDCMDCYTTLLHIGRVLGSSRGDQNWGGKDLAKLASEGLRVAACLPVKLYCLARPQIPFYRMS